MKYYNHYVISQKGFTLLEVMISLVILSVGLLGVAGLQSLGLQMNSDAMQRTQANMLSYSIAEKMRIHPKSALAGDYEGTLAKAANDDVCDELSSDADDALLCWQVFLRDQIPTGSIAISAVGDSHYPYLCTGSGNELDSNEIGIEVSWTDNWIERGMDEDNIELQTSCQTFVFNIRNM